VATSALDVQVVALDGIAPSLRHAIGALIDAAGAAGAPALSDQARIDLDNPAAAPPPRMAFGVLATHGRGAALVGYGGLARHGGSWAVEAAVAPDPPVPAGVVTGAIVKAAREQVAGLGGGILRWWRHGRASDDDSPVEGFALERELLQLRVPLPLSGAPSSAAVRAFRPGADEAAWLEVNNRAFAGHPEQSGWTLDDLVSREAEPWFDPDGFLLHEATGRLAAFCWTKVHRAEQMGEIYVIGVDPDFQGRGLGRALTTAGLGHLASVGMPVGMLYVDADNVAAVALYRALGFTRHHADRAYVADIAPAPH
jgi:mycothiol synthase